MPLVQEEQVSLLLGGQVQHARPQDTPAEAKGSVEDSCSYVPLLSHSAPGDAILSLARSGSWSDRPMGHFYLSFLFLQETWADAFCVLHL